jgi:hypothetical protein
MSDDRPDADEPDPAARRASEWLLELRQTPPAPGTALTRRVVRHARLQHAIAAPLRLLGTFVAALFDGMRGAAGKGGHRR